MNSRLLLVKMIFVLPLLLGGCSAIYNTADRLGSNLPTIGEPCRNWQCITSSGQQKSDENTWLKEYAEEVPVQKAPVRRKSFPTTPHTPSPAAPAQ